MRAKATGDRWAAWRARAPSSTGSGRGFLDVPGYAAALGADAGGAVDEDLPDLHDLLHLGPLFVEISVDVVGAPRGEKRAGHSRTRA